MIDNIVLISKFEVITYGKWILAGEHSVIRGSEALVFPLKSAQLKLSFRQDLPKAQQRLKFTYEGSKGHEYELLFHSVFQKAREILDVPDEFFQDCAVCIESNLPVGAGLGASAALCVAVTKMFLQLGFLGEDTSYEFALQMENIFHGESSGVDIAACFLGAGIIFQRGLKKEKLASNWQPPLYVSYSGQRGMTFDCVEKVKTMMSRDPQKGDLIDQEMKMAVSLSKEAFAGQDILVLAQAMKRAQQCFADWDLCPSSMIVEMEKLKHNGAIAVKPTGSGGGGFILSLWETAPSPEVVRELELMSCF
jgi:mevalonate kinase